MDPFSSMVNLFTDDCHHDNLKPDICGCSLSLIQGFHTCVLIHIKEPGDRSEGVTLRSGSWSWLKKTITMLSFKFYMASVWAAQ